MTYVNPTDQFRYEIETESHDLGITYVYTDDVDNAVQYCCDVSRDYQTCYSLVRDKFTGEILKVCLLYTSPSPRDCKTSRMPSSA